MTYSIIERSHSDWWKINLLFFQTRESYVRFYLERIVYILKHEQRMLCKLEATAYVLETNNTATCQALNKKYSG